MSDALVAEKAALRRAMLARRSALPAEEAAAASRAACDHLVEFALARDVRRVALYAGMKGELDASHAARRLAAAGVELYYPRVVGRARPLVFHRVDDPATLVPSALGIPEPAADAPEVDAPALDLLVVPGLAFDRRGGRLGWGGGYYDAVLTRAPAVPAIGICFELQRVDAVPCTLRDERVDVLVTEHGARSTQAAEA